MSRPDGPEPKPRKRIVDCDENCGAFVDPGRTATYAELRATLEHYRDHEYVGGCSHGC